jgi:hypothetical protein
MSNAGATTIACLLIACATVAAVLHVLPSEAYAAILGGFVPGLALVIQRNTYTDAIKRSMRPESPGEVPDEIEWKGKP